MQYLVFLNVLIRGNQIHINGLQRIQDVEQGSEFLALIAMEMLIHVKRYITRNS